MFATLLVYMCDINITIIIKTAKVVEFEEHLPLVQNVVGEFLDSWYSISHLGRWWSVRFLAFNFNSFSQETIRSFCRC